MNHQTTTTTTIIIVMYLIIITTVIKKKIYQNQIMIHFQVIVQVYLVQETMMMKIKKQMKYLQQ